LDAPRFVTLPAPTTTDIQELVSVIARPPLAKERLCQRQDELVMLKLKRPWSDGTIALIFEPEVFVERLAALVPPPRANTVLYPLWSSTAWSRPGCRFASA